MRRQSPSYSPPPRRGRGRSRSPSPRGRYPPRREPPTSLLVRNLPKSCRAEDLRAPFKRFGSLRDVYLPKDYHTGEPRGFGFVQFLDPLDAEEAQYHMNHQLLYGRELTVVFAEENRKKPAEMRSKERMRSRGFSEDDGRPYYSHRRRSRTRSRSRSPPRWDRYSRFSHDHSPVESPARSPSPDRQEPRGRRHEGGWSGSESRKYVDRSPSGSPVSFSGRYSHKISKHETGLDSRREVRQSARGRHKSPSRSDGSLVERYSRSPPRSPSSPRQKSPSGSDGSPDERYCRSPPRPSLPPKEGHSSRHSMSPLQDDDSQDHSDKERSDKEHSNNEQSSMDD